jgi:hypothetical protein
MKVGKVRKEPVDLGRIKSIEVKQLRNNNVGDVIFDRAANTDDALKE